MSTSRTRSTIQPGTVRSHCPLECGWFHDEVPGAGPVAPVPFQPDVRDLNEAISAIVQAQSSARLARVEKAIIDHLREGHPNG